MSPAGRACGIYVDRNRTAGTLNFYYRARPVGGRERPGDDAAEIGWFGRTDLPERVAYPSHARVVLADWLPRLHSRL